jgi:hypothetical protein
VRVHRHQGQFVCHDPSLPDTRPSQVTD